MCSYYVMTIIWVPYDNSKNGIAYKSRFFDLNTKPVPFKNGFYFGNIILVIFNFRI